MSDELENCLSRSDLPLERIVQRSLLNCTPRTSVREAAERMVAARCSSIVVMDGGVPVGIWTERDALKVEWAEGGGLDRPVAEVMSAPVKCIDGSLSLGEAAVRFQREGVRHFVVTAPGGGVRGIVTQTDVVLNRGIECYLRMAVVGSILRGEPVRVDGAESLATAARRMRESRADSVVVEVGDGVLGILTERDILRFVATLDRPGTVGELCSKPLVSVSIHDTLYSVRFLLNEQRIRHVGVVDDEGRLAGVLSFSDLLSSAEHLYVDELQGLLAERDMALSVSKRNLLLAEQVIDASLEGIIITDINGVILSVNPAFTRVTGYSAAEAVGQTPKLLRSGCHDAAFYQQMWTILLADGVWQGEIWNRRKNGELYVELLTITAVPDEKGERANYAAVFSDITKLKESEQRIESLSYNDMLTGLPTQRVFKDRLSVALFQAHRDHDRLAVMMVGLDRFQRVNESLGHEAGDRLLQAVAGRLQENLRENDFLARMGGDEYLILVPSLDHVEDAVKRAWWIIEAFQQPFIIDGNPLVMTASIGISLYPDDGINPETLMMNADAAMFRAKGEARSSFQLYAHAMNTRAAERLWLENELRRALDEDALELHYQPLVEPAGEAVVSAEALLRWIHPERGFIPPAEFIPVAEDCGLIIPIGEWVLREACRQQRAWRDAGLAPVPVAVNISGLQFREHDFLHTTKAVLSESGIDPRLLRFELTESVIMEDAAEAIQMLKQIRDMGISVSVDDFGTGYSSLAYLKRFPISTLKIDRSFVSDITEDPDDFAIVRSIITLGHSLRLNVVAEGVENGHQLELLRQEGCDFIQGFHFSKALPAAEFAGKYLG
ncbi:EAL domain-containing protein [Endothiovibrio diazotrophicus]